MNVQQARVKRASPAAGHGTAAGRSKASAVGASYSAFDLPIQCLNAAKENTDDARNDALIVTGRKGARSCATFRSTFPPNPPLALEAESKSVAFKSGHRVADRKDGRCALNREWPLAA